MLDSAPKTLWPRMVGSILLKLKSNTYCLFVSNILVGLYREKIIKCGAVQSTYYSPVVAIPVDIVSHV